MRDEIVLPVVQASDFFAWEYRRSMAPGYTPVNPASRS